LAQFGAPGIYSFPSGGYRIQATASPDPAALGPGRAGSLRSDLNIMGNFLAGADLVDWDNNLSQSFGVFGRITGPGFGTTRGYAFTYSTAGLLAISVINNETLTTLTSEAYRLNPAKDYHLTFSATGRDFAGELFELPPEGGRIPVAVIGISDSTYSSGVTGLGVFSNVGSGVADATFDNYQAFTFIVPEPRTWSILTIGATGLLYAAARRRRRDSGHRALDEKGGHGATH